MKPSDISVNMAKYVNMEARRDIDVQIILKICV